MLLPFLLGALVLIAIPAAAMLPLIFATYDSLSAPTWAGWQNVAYVFSDYLFWIAARNSIFFVALAVPPRVLGALAIALLLNQRRRGVGLYRVAVYLPTVIPDVAYALIWLWIFNPIYGPLNMVLGALGLPTPAWLVDRNTALPAIVLMSLFQIGEGIVIFLAALRDVPEEYYQAAAIDGGSRWQMFHSITLPLLAPWLVLLTARDIILSAQNTFSPAYLMTGGGPYYATLFIPLLIYEEAFDRFRFGEAALMLLLLFLWLGILLWLAFTFAGGWGYADDV
jgi:multiple sugar transport system permease protein